ncbi:hypothetical protein GN958_ATG08772 [Phytophthora infestans]|uniref:Uncharacterized protein n=1 Tax=Phytophthora infestans TaxID=4787 RepID=A0A8S9URV4_PHYIN|nr:hypothetical protein GN958_ATG08772 [Phytophthora infestans]
MHPWTLKELQLDASNGLKLGPNNTPRAVEKLRKPVEYICNRGNLEYLLLGTKTTVTSFRVLPYEPTGDGRDVDTKLVSAMVCESLSERLLYVMSHRVNEGQVLIDGIPLAALIRGSMLETTAHPGTVTEREVPTYTFLPNNVRAFESINVLIQLGLLDQVKVNPRRFALLFSLLKLTR